LSAFPDIATVRRRMQALATLDAILSAEWEDRYFSFDLRWAAAEQMGSMRDGQGNHYFAWFGPGGCWIKGFDHESALSPFRHKPPQLAVGLFENVPAAFKSCLHEPAFVLDETTFCIWRETNDAAWQHGPVKLPANDPDPDGSAALLAPLDGRPQTYADWAAEYFERKLPIAAVEAVYRHEPLDADLLRAIHPGRKMAELQPDLLEIGYPVAPDLRRRPRGGRR
jgi:hypothetical protein